MFLKNNMRPATAGAAPAPSSRTNDARTRETMMFNTAHSEAEEFNAFSSDSGRETKRNAPRPSGKKKGMNKAALIIGSVAVLALLLVLLATVAVLNAERHIMDEGNAFLAYSDSDGDYHVLTNGFEIEKDFEGEVQVVPAADNSFAYVLDNGGEGIYIYVLKGKKIEAITTSPASAVLAFATLEPGVVYQENSKFYLYSEEFGEERITGEPTADNFVLSGDASTVAYTEAVKDNSGVNKLMIYQDGSSTPLDSKNNCTPVAVSNYGDYVYGSTMAGDVKKMCVFSTKNLDDPDKILVTDSDGFVSIVAMNAKGNEALFVASALTETGAEITTRIYRFGKNDDKASILAKGMLTPTPVDRSIVIYDNFSDIYLTGVNQVGTEISSATYYLNSKYQASKVAAFSGEIDPKGRYLYYVNKDMELMQLDLTDKNYPTNEVTQDVVDFVITEKSNLYILDDDNKLRFYEAAKDYLNRAISSDVTSISFYRYSNTVYFTEEEAVSVYSSREGSEKDNVKMDGTQLTSIPLFSDTSSKRSYAYYYDVDNGWMIFYTSNGKSFDLVTNDCQDIPGVEIPDIVG